MASGIPVIATAAGGTLDMIRPGVDGFPCAARDARALADTVRALDAQRDD